tara:strand:+ start:135094 stop:135894 length:801 start_codon:yes stop_codon:yes gene_type:complete
MADLYMRNIRDWREATLMLTFEERGYFDEILNLIYLYDDMLPDDDDLICRAMPIHRRMHERLKEKLIKCGLIEIKDGLYFNKRAAKEVKKINKLSTKNRSKAENRWTKSLESREKGDAAADAGAMLKVKVNSESESYLTNKSKRCKNAKSTKTRHDDKRNSKCTIDEILDPDGQVPKEYLAYAKEQGLKDPQRVFLDWANWWLGENGRKAGPRGWLATWKARVRKDVDRQMAGNKNKAGRSGTGACATTAGARLALDRRRNRRRKI